MQRDESHVMPAIDTEIRPLLQTAIEHHQGGRLQEAELLYEEILRRVPAHPDALNYLGAVAHAKGDNATAENLIAKSIQVRPEDAFAHCNMGNVLLALKRHDAALASYEQSLKLHPNLTQALYNRGNALLDMGNFQQALLSFDRVLQFHLDFAAAHCNRGHALLGLRLAQDALASFAKAAELNSEFTEAICGQGAAFQALKQYDSALACFGSVLQSHPDHAHAYNSLGNVLQDVRRYEDALTCYRQAVQLQPDYAEAHNNLGVVLQELKNTTAALGSYAKALQIKPDYVQAMGNLGSAFQQLRRYHDAAACYRAVLDLDPSHRYALGMLVNCAFQSCDWPTLMRCIPLLRAGIARGDVVVMPFTLLGCPLSQEERLIAAKDYLRYSNAEAKQPMWIDERYSHGKIRLAYLSADFHQHPTAHLMSGLFASHDRSRFEVIGISFGPDDQSAIRLRLIAGFDQFYDVRFNDDVQIATLLRKLEVDIAVDLKGYTQDARPGILSHRPAPIQVSYLGYPETMGADFIDYIVADKCVLPFEDAAYYPEKVVHLPGCYQINDAGRAVSAEPPTRTECGLPENGFVFCSFNNNYKITPEVFAIWMRLLCQIPGSVLWLLQDNESARSNLCREALAQGVDPDRLVFAPRISPEAHLARHRLADLFLDTLPINAHTTASDALWMGLPLITCRGESFAGRVAASLLQAMCLPELIVENLDGYERLALQLATDSESLHNLRSKLERNRLSSSLFDTKQCTRYLETAYRTMWERQRQGDKPEAFTVEGGSCLR